MGTNSKNSILAGKPWLFMISVDGRPNETSGGDYEERRARRLEARAYRNALVNAMYKFLIEDAGADNVYVVSESSYLGPTAVPPRPKVQGHRANSPLIPGTKIDNFLLKSVLSSYLDFNIDSTADRFSYSSYPTHDFIHQIKESNPNARILYVPMFLDFDPEVSGSKIDKKFINSQFNKLVAYSPVPIVIAQSENYSPRAADWNGITPFHVNTKIIGSSQSWDGRSIVPADVSSPIFQDFMDWILSGDPAMPLKNSKDVAKILRKDLDATAEIVQAKEKISKYDKGVSWIERYQAPFVIGGAFASLAMSVLLPSFWWVFGLGATLAFGGFSSSRKENLLHKIYTQEHHIRSIEKNTEKLEQKKEKKASEEKSKQVIVESPVVVNNLMDSNSNTENDNNVEEESELWERLDKRHQKIVSAYLDYEIDLAKSLEYPLMIDAGDPKTAALIRSILKTADIKEHEDRSKVSASSSKFYDAVVSLEIAFTVAENNARKVGGTVWDSIERKKVKTAKALHSVVMDDNASQNERRGAFAQIFKTLEGVALIPEKSETRMRQTIGLIEEA